MSYSLSKVEIIFSSHDHDVSNRSFIRISGQVLYIYTAKLVWFSMVACSNNVCSGRYFTFHMNCKKGTNESTNDQVNLNPGLIYQVILSMFVWQNGQHLVGCQNFVQVGCHLKTCQRSTWASDSDQSCRQLLTFPTCCSHISVEHFLFNSGGFITSQVQIYIL